jgi:uncharacterized membrane protein
MNMAEQTINLNQAERWISGCVGGVLVSHAVTQVSKRPGRALMEGILGGLLVRRGATGHCAVKERLIASDAQPRHAETIASDEGVKVEHAVTINRPIEDVYSFWRSFENLPLFMHHLKQVEVTGPTRSHWIAKGPAGMDVEWDAEILNEHPNELIAWQSLEGSAVNTAGSVKFKAEPHGKGTEVHVNLKYDPPAGKVGVAVAKLFGDDPQHTVLEDLRAFKSLLESGEEATVEGQTAARGNQT